MTFTLQQNITDSPIEEDDFILPDAPNKNDADTSHMMLADEAQPVESNTSDHQTSPESEPQSNSQRPPPLEVDLTIDDDNSVELKHFDDDVEEKHLDDLKQFDDINFERDSVGFTDDVEVIEIKMNVDDVKEVDNDELYDDSSCQEDLFDDIANVHIQDEASSIAPSESILDQTVEDKALDTEEMAILQNDLNTMVNDPIGNE